MIRFLKSVADALASFQLSVTILFLMGIVTFFGTTYQVEHGLLQAQQEYFYSWIVGHRWGRLVFPLPGGQLLMAVLAVNMLFGGLWRIRKSWPATWSSPSTASTAVPVRCRATPSKSPVSPIRKPARPRRRPGETMPPF